MRAVGRANALRTNQYSPLPKPNGRADMQASGRASGWASTSPHSYHYHYLRRFYDTAVGEGVGAVNPSDRLNRAATYYVRWAARGVGVNKTN